MKYYDNDDLRNVIALCTQDEKDNCNTVAKNLIKRCEKALAYRDIVIRFTKKDREFLLDKMEKGMDESARFTIMRIMGV